MARENRVTSYLIADHDRLHALLATSCAGEALDGEAFSRFRAGLLRHIGIEEKLLLPSVRRNRGGNAIARARELRVEHAALTSLLVPTPDLALCREKEALLASHDAREEGPGGVYEECEQHLTEGESVELAARALAFPDVPLAPHFDGPRVHRTAAEALTSARRIKKAAGTAP